MIHDLQQNIKDIRMRFFDLVEQQHAMRLFSDCLGQQTALIKPHITRRRTNQPRHRVALHVL